MESVKIEDARRTISIAVIMRLMGNAFIALLTASFYSDTRSNLLRIDGGRPLLPYIIAALFIDSALTILWQLSKTVHTLHLGLYILAYGFGYMFYLIDVFNLLGAAVLGALLLAPIMWVIGLVPFIVCGIGRKRLTKALAGDKNE